MQPTRTILNNFGRGAPVKVGQYPVNGFRGVVSFKMLKHHRKARQSTKVAVQFTICTSAQVSVKSLNG